MKDGSDILIVICSFLAFSEIVTVVRAVRSGRAPTGIAPLGYLRPGAKFVSKGHKRWSILARSCRQIDPGHHLFRRTRVVLFQELLITDAMSQPLAARARS